MENLGMVITCAIIALLVGFCVAWAFIPAGETIIEPNEKSCADFITECEVCEECAECEECVECLETAPTYYRDLAYDEFLDAYLYKIDVCNGTEFDLDEISVELEDTFGFDISNWDKPKYSVFFDITAEYEDDDLVVCEAVYQVEAKYYKDQVTYDIV